MSAVEGGIESPTIFLDSTGSSIPAIKGNAPYGRLPAAGGTEGRSTFRKTNGPSGLNVASEVPSWLDVVG